MNGPQVSVVVPTRNRSAMLRRTVQAILAQAGVDLELIVVDEASEDDTSILLERVRKRDSRLRVVAHERPRGLPAARNSGLAEATGEWVAFCDDDDLWAPDKLAAQLAALDAMPDSDWCACGTVWFNPRFEIVRSYTPPGPGDVASLLLQYNAVPAGGSGVIARTLAVREAGAFDTALKWGEDWDMWIRLALRSPVATVPRPLAGYAIHEQNMSGHSPRFNRDVDRIDAKYASERRQRHVTLDRATLEQAQADIELRAGRRWSAAWHFLGEAVQGRRPSALRRALAAALVPQRMLRRRADGHLERVPPSWQAEAEAWLGPLRAGSSTVAPEAVQTGQS